VHGPSLWPPGRRGYLPPVAFHAYDPWRRQHSTSPQPVPSISYTTLSNLRPYVLTPSYNMSACGVAWLKKRFTPYYTSKSAVDTSRYPFPRGSAVIYRTRILLRELQLHSGNPELGCARRISMKRSTSNKKGASGLS
jgi:hypothetical protein